MNPEKNYIVAQGGITLEELHKQLAPHNLALSNVGSISELSLAGVISVATHGSGINYPVLSKQVLELKLLLADGSVATCSPSERPELFRATLCGLGSTGFMLAVKLEVERLFHLKERQWTRKFDDAIDNLPELVHSAEHVRFWWFPQNGNVRCSAADRTLDVSVFLLPFTACIDVCICIDVRSKLLPAVGCGILYWVITSFNSSFSLAAFFLS